ncbi:MAG: fasciclin domain-containing protein [Alphaproteobacteria bacterium]
MLTFVRAAVLAAGVIVAGMGAPAAKADDIVDTAVKAGFTKLVAAVKAAELVDALKGEGPLTVFAPTDAAFEALGEEALADLLKPENKAKLQGILLYHVVSGKVVSGDLAGKVMDVETLQKGLIHVDATDGVKVNTASVTTADVMADNGVIHVIDTVLIPGAEGKGAHDGMKKH